MIKYLLQKLPPKPNICCLAENRFQKTFGLRVNLDKTKFIYFNQDGPTLY